MLSGNPHDSPVTEGLLSALSYSWGNKASEGIDSLLKATQLYKEESRVSVPILLHLKELLIFKQIIPTGLVLEISCLISVALLVSTPRVSPERRAPEPFRLPSTCSL